MKESLLLLAGPAFAIIGLVLSAVPSLRPRIFARTLAVLAICMSVPMATGLMFHSLSFVTVGFVIKPITFLIGVALFIAYLMWYRSQRLPLRTVLPPLLILMAAFADIFALRELAEQWGAAC